MDMNPDLSTVLQQLTSLLKNNNLKVVTAESCTGGLVASWLTKYSGSSTWFDCGFVTYSNSAKINLLNVPCDLIELYGAVSEQVAQAMALGALKNSSAHLALAITGIAGPTGESANKPIGMVCFAWVIEGMPIKLLTMCFPKSSRYKIRHWAGLYALEGAIALLKDYLAA